MLKAYLECWRKDFAETLLYHLIGLMVLDGIVWLYAKLAILGLVPTLGIPVS